MEMFELCTLLLTYALCFSCHVLYLFIISWALTFTMFINWVKYDYAINVYLCIGWMHSIVCLFCCVGINDNSMLKTLKSLQNLPNAIFIYGTLKRGQPNHYVLEKFGNHIFFGTGCTELRYPLIIDRDSNLPFLLDSPGKGQVHCILLLIALVGVVFFTFVLEFAISSRKWYFYIYFFSYYWCFCLNYYCASAQWRYAKFCLSFHLSVHPLSLSSLCGLSCDGLCHSYESASCLSILRSTIGSCQTSVELSQILFSGSEPGVAWSVWLMVPVPWQKGHHMLMLKQLKCSRLLRSVVTRVKDLGECPMWLCR